MGEAERSDVLRRKARTGREEHQARVMTPPRALRLALSRVADERFDMALAVSSIHVAEAGQDGTVAAFSEDLLIMLLDGPGGRIGAAAVDLAVLSGLIEMQTMGRVLKRPPDPRVPTQTDAALVAPLIEGMLAGFAENLEGAGEALAWAAGWRFGALIEGPRLLGLMLEADDFHVFRLEIDLGGGAKTGEIVLALPLAPDPVAEDGAQGGAEPGGEAGAATGAGVVLRLKMGQGALLDAPAPLAAVLHRLRMPLAEIAALKPGDLLPIPRAALSETRLESARARTGISCRLGQINGFRAVRLNGGAGGGRGGDAGLGGAREAEMATYAGSGYGADIDDDPGTGLGIGALPEPGLADLVGGLALSETGAGLAEMADSPFDLPDLDDLPALGGDAAPDGLPDLGGLPDLADLPELGDIGDLSDLPELALE